MKIKDYLTEKRPDITTVVVTSLYNDKDKKTILSAARKFGGDVVSKDPIKITFRSDRRADEFWEYVNPRLVYSALELTYK